MEGTRRSKRLTPSQSWELPNDPPPPPHISPLRLSKVSPSPPNMPPSTPIVPPSGTPTVPATQPTEDESINPPKAPHITESSIASNSPLLSLQSPLRSNSRKMYVAAERSYSSSIDTPQTEPTNRTCSSFSFAASIRRAPYLVLLAFPVLLAFTAVMYNIFDIRKLIQTYMKPTIPLRAPKSELSIVSIPKTPMHEVDMQLFELYAQIEGLKKATQMLLESQKKFDSDSQLLFAEVRQLMAQQHMLEARFQEKALFEEQTASDAAEAAVMKILNAAPAHSDGVATDIFTEEKKLVQEEAAVKPASNVEWSLATLGGTIVFDNANYATNWMAFMASFFARIARASAPSHMSHIFQHKIFNNAPALGSYGPGVILSGVAIPGKCYCFAGGSGNFTLTFATPIYIHKISVEYPPSAEDPFPHAALKNFSIYIDSPLKSEDTIPDESPPCIPDTFGENPTTESDILPFCVQDNTDEKRISTIFAPSSTMHPFRANWKPAGSFVYQQPSTHPHQHFTPKAEAATMPQPSSAEDTADTTFATSQKWPIASRVKFSVMSNYGGDYTCLYHLGVQGELVGPSIW